MALFAQLAVIRVRAAKMFRTAEEETAFLTRLTARSRNVSDRDTIQAISNLHELLVDLVAVVGSIVAALEHIDKDSRGALAGQQDGRR
jgi:hypothetical protein